MSFDLDDSEAEEPLVEHDDFVLVAAVVHDVAQRQQGRHVCQNCAAPHRVALVGYQHLLLVGSDGVVQHHRILVLIWRREVVLERKKQEMSSYLQLQNNMLVPHSGLVLLWGKYLMQFEGHAYAWCHNSIQQVHVGEHPFVSRRRDAKIPLEKGVEAVEKRLQAVTQINDRHELVV